MRRSGGGSTPAPPPAGGGGAQCFATIAALAAFDTAANPDVCNGFVETVWDWWQHDPASALAADGITVIAATGGGRWIRQENAAEKWALLYAGTTQEINPAAGNDENTGLAGSPLRTWAELKRRLHGLNVAGTQTVNIIGGNLAASDPAIKNWTNITGAQTGAFTVNGVRTLSVTGATGAVTTTAHGTYDVTAPFGAGSVGRLVEFLVGAGPAVRCTGWIMRDLGAGVFRVSQALNGAGVETAPVAGDTFNVYTLTEVPDMFDETDESSQNGNIANNIRVNNPGGGNFAQLLGFQLRTCDVNARVYFSRGATGQTLNNCRFVPPDTSFGGAFSMFAGYVAVAPGGETLWYQPSAEKTLFAFAPSVAFQGVRLFPESVEFAGNVRLSFFDNTAGTACLRMSGCSGVLDQLRGTGNTIPGWQLDDPPNRIRVLNVPTLVTTGQEIQLPGPGLGVQADFADLGITSIRSNTNHVLIGAGGTADDADPAVVAIADCDVDVVPGNIVYATAAGILLATNIETIRVAGVVLTTAVEGANTLIATAGPVWVLIDGALPTVGNMVWLSSTVAGEGTATVPSNGIATEIGICLATSGSRALVALAIRRVPTQLRTPYVYDEFLGGSHSSATVGMLGWGFTNGTWVRVPPSPDHPGIMRRTSSATSGQVSSWYLTAFTGATTIRQDQWSSWTWVVLPSDSGANSHDVRIGVSGDWTANPPTNGVYFERLTTEANWFVVTRSGGVQTRTNTGIAYTAATYYTLHARKNAAGSIEFFIGGALVATHAANIPAGSTALVEGGHLIPNTAAARSLDIDFFDEQFLIMSR
jgi:hypothetical protein